MQDGRFLVTRERWQSNLAVISYGEMGTFLPYCEKWIKRFDFMGCPAYTIPETTGVLPKLKTPASKQQGFLLAGLFDQNHEDYCKSKDVLTQNKQEDNRCHTQPIP